jgi:hypothetical protein
MKFFIPNIIDTALITEDVELACIFTNLFSKRTKYLPIIEPPRRFRPDASNEAVKINNAIARAGCKNIIYGNLFDDEKKLLAPFFPPSFVNNANTKQELPRFNSRHEKEPQLISGRKNLSISILNALKYNMTISLSDNPPIQQSNAFKGRSKLLFIAEDREDITSVIIANYAYAFDASLIVIDSIDSEKVKEINESFFHIYDSKTVVYEKLERIKHTIKAFVPELELDSYINITFFTSGLPFGFSFPEIPTSHIFNYPMLGTNLLNYIGVEKNPETKIKVALTIDPGSFEESESATFMKSLVPRNLIVRKLHSADATINNAHLFLSTFPADLILITSHAKEVEGYRTTYVYKDTENIERKLIRDEAIALGWDPLTEKFHFTEFASIVSLDDIDWLDHERKNKHYVGRAILDFIDLQKTNKHTEYKISSEKIPSVHMAMAYSMTDGNFFPTFHGLADERSPIIISNACSSWRKVSLDVSYAGCRVYIGPIRDIMNFEAIDFIGRLFKKHLDRSLSLGVWRAQNEMYEDGLRRPYLVLGTHFTKLNFPSGSQTNYLRKQLDRSASRRNKKSILGKSPDIRESSQRFEVFLTEELATLNLCINGKSELYISKYF